MHFGAETSEVASEFEDQGSNASGEEDVEVPIVEEVPPVRPSVRVQRAGFELLDQWNLSELFSHRASVMRTIPRFLWGSFRIAMKVEGGTRRDHNRSAGEERSPARTRLEVVLGIATHALALFPQRRQNQQGQVDQQV